MRPKHRDRPTAVILIALFQFAKGAFLLIVAAFLWLTPEALPNSAAFSRMLFIAAHGKDLSGILVPIFGCYLVYIGFGLLWLRPSTRTNLAISSAITIALSLQRLGLFGESDMTDLLDRQTLYILILLDFAIYIYLVYHPAITSSFNREKRFPQVHS
jgi:hypothetical protein